MERQMFERGYVSARMIAAKAGVHVMTIRSIVRDAEARLDVVHMGKSQRFYGMKSVEKYFGTLYELADFSDWRDVVEGSNGKRRR
jgi:hypothetical protein